MSEEVDKKALYKKWQSELEKSKKWFRRFHKMGDKTVKQYLDERTAQDDEFGEYSTKLNLFYSNIVTLMSMLYGRVPKVEADRRFADADDDVARVAGQMLTRILNTDIEAAGEDIASVFRNGIQDRLIVGLGTARLQYQLYEQAVNTPPIMGADGEELAPEVNEQKIEAEWVDTVYTHWRDILWSPARTHPEVWWKAYRSYLNKEKFKARFPKIDLKKITFSSKGPIYPKQAEDDQDVNQVEVWEIWDKDHKCVYWWTESYEEILDHMDDPLELEGFWPDPPPLISNITTLRYLPKPDFAMAQDLYREINELETRITMLTRACKAVGVYNKAEEGIKRIFTEGVENDLIPVDNWAAFSERGGVEGAIDWVPIKDIAEVVTILSQKQAEKIQQLYQVTGMNDIMRGAAQAGSERVSATQRKLEANYGSIRIEALQNEFARWVGDLQGIKAEIIAKHYQPESIIQQSNIMATPDAQFAQAAVALIKDPEKSRWKITVRPETLAIADYAQLKQDRVEYINGMATFLQSSAPILELEPGAKNMLIQLMKWGLAGFRGSNEIEGIIDSEMAKMEKNPPPPKQDPAMVKAQAEKEKMGMEMQMSQQENQAKMQMEAAKHQADMQMEQMKLQMEQKKLEMELYFMQKKYEMEMQALQMKLGFKAQEVQLEAQANEQEQAAQYAFNTAEREGEAQANKEDREHAQKVEMESGDAELARDKQRAKLKPKPNGNARS